MMKGKEIRIMSLLVLDSIFFILELTIGYMSHSLALIADSFHMLNDIISLLVALWAVKVAKERDPDSKYTYGWKRAEILGALINAVFLIALCFSILIESIQRLIQPQVVENPKLVMSVGFAGLVSNILGLFLFHEHDHDHGVHDEEAGNGIGSSHQHMITNTSRDAEESDDHTHSHSVESTPNDVLTNTTVDILRSGNDDVNESNNNEDTPLVKKTTLIKRKKKSAKKPKKSTKSLNMRGVFLHVMGDALGNIGVISAAWFIWKTDYSWRYYSDPLVSLFITLIIFSSALPLSRKASKILLQATPSSISADEIRDEILEIPGILAVHDFHIWNLTEATTIASIHVKLDISPEEFVSTAKLIRHIFHNHGVHSATVQPEFSSDQVSAQDRRRFSIIAGGVDDNSPTPCTAYGSTTRDTDCLVDNAANCYSDRCK
ncbi:similar to Saccharomyces cerevisiae YOR316C COT1 Vacuolar transporter that mediates zinc transport into the vacuole [Maudiozyma barnettii]|uniref:Similar to Saccharomyces cerevisiae YOR316C COT1 Vacuolar transporter that mediates zinc transport into the vacuole n=1 Tax=Maudiozyma barnettii TaxID=61262 RepID=A0A8H2VCF1_9SACH|nr:uncharacterized protein KABA2_02S01364 [Kazachstania barnettii]CAB4252657.1 similar to Saccharomyces cerevisiae YOR316C COT1 Vacuolar transporter that mediates zinc transport into the vacuole [Kazachstania barnettii]CAD1780129.1 similar to Saccharomyces cerevisiae YOR316C COT1 Vacuolar transporter that mediates zinc transport into the vacuole [Kazachstania barnettii]